MREKTERYAQRLEGMSTVELSRSAEKLVSFERRHVAALIAHLAEISRRKGHLELGYRSLFHYCLECLRLGEGSVWKRTQVAGVARRFPQVLEHLAQGKVSLSVLAILAPHLTKGNVDGVLKEAEGKTTREAKEIVAALHPKPAVESMIRRRPVRSREHSSESGEDCSEMSVQSEEARGPMRGATVPESRLAARRNEPKPEGRLEAARPEVYNFRFSAGRELKEKLERLAEVLGFADAGKHMPEILDVALDLALDKKDPKRKLARRRKREAARRETSPEEVRRDSGTAEEEKITNNKGRGVRGREVHPRSRCMPSSVRERVLERASYQCEYTGAGGVRCTARAGLEIDHVEPWAKGGGAGEENLRVLCRAHNLFSAAREFGEGFVRGKIDSGRSDEGARVLRSNGCSRV